MTGTFDDWGKTVQLEKKGNVFEKEVHLPTIDGKIQYKVRRLFLTISPTSSASATSSVFSFFISPSRLRLAVGSCGATFEEQKPEHPTM